MVDFKKIPPLDWQTPMVDPQTGFPSAQFLRLWQEMFQNGAFTQGEVAGKADKTTQINTTAPINGGGDLSADRTIGHDESGVVPGVYTSPEVTVDEFGHITDIIDGVGGGIELEEAGVPVTGGPFTTLNFNSGATVVDATGGVADIDIAGGGGGGTASIELISSTILTSDQASVAFVVPSGYRDLILRGSVRSTTGGNREDFAMTANSDTGGSKYFRNYGSIVSGAYSVFQDANRGNFPFVWAPSGGAPSEQWGTFEARISDYLMTDRYKNIRCHAETSISSTDNITIDVSGAWRSTAAITSLQTFMTAGNIKAGSRISLYGVRA